MYEIAMRIHVTADDGRAELRRLRQEIAHTVKAGMGDGMKASTSTALVRVNQSLAQQAKLLHQAARAWASYAAAVANAKRILFMPGPGMKALPALSGSMRMLAGPGVPALTRPSAIGRAAMGGAGGSRTIDAEWWYSKSGTSGPEAGLNRIRAAMRRVGREKDRLAANFIWFGRVMRNVFNSGTTNITNIEHAARDTTRKAAGHFGFFGNFVRGIFFRMRWLIQMTFAGALLFGPIAFVNASIKKFLDFERSISQALLRVPNKFRGMWGELANTAFDISRRIGTSVTKTAESLRFGLGAGFKTIKEASEISVAASRLAIASMSDFGQSTAAITNMLEGFGLESNQASRAADVLFAGMQQGTLDMHDLEQGMERLSPIFHETGATMEDMIATTALMSRSAQGEMTVFTELAQATQRLISPSNDSRAAMASLGVQLVRTNMGGIDWLETISRMGERLRKLSGGDPKRMAQLLGQIVPGGQGGRSQRALLRLFGTDPADIRAVRDAVYNATGAVGRGLDDVNVRAFRTWEKFKATAERMFISVGLAIMKALEPAVRAVDQFLKQFEVGQPMFDDLADKITIWAARVVQGLTVVLDALAIIVSVFERISDLMDNIGLGKGRMDSGEFERIKPRLDRGPEFLRRQRGGIVPGVGTGDIVPALLEPGELVVPRHIVRRMASGLGMQGGGQVPDISGPEFENERTLLKGQMRHMDKTLSLDEVKRLNELNQPIERLSDAFYEMIDALRDLTAATILEREQRIKDRAVERGKPKISQEAIARTSPSEAYRELTPQQRARATRTGAFETVEFNPATRQMETRRINMAEVRGAAQRERRDEAKRHGGTSYEVEFKGKKVERIESRSELIRQQADTDRLRRQGIIAPAGRLPAERGFIGPPRPPARVRSMDLDIKSRAGIPPSGRIIGPDGTVYDADSPQAKRRADQALGLQRGGMADVSAAREAREARATAAKLHQDSVIGRAKERREFARQGIFPGAGATPGLMGRQPGTDGAATGGGRIKRLPWEEGYNVVPDVRTPGDRGPVPTGGVAPPKSSRQIDRDRQEIIDKARQADRDLTKNAANARKQYSQQSFDKMIREKKSGLEADAERAKANRSAIDLADPSGTGYRQFMDELGMERSEKIRQESDTRVKAGEERVRTVYPGQTSSNAPSPEELIQAANEATSATSLITPQVLSQLLDSFNEIVEWKKKIENDVRVLKNGPVA